MKKKKIFCFFGASGTGKSTLLNYIRESYDVDVKELSGREFLPKDNSYDVTLTDEIQVQISYNRLVEFINALVSDRVSVFSRSTLDNMAYAMTLGKAEYLLPIQKKEVKYLIDHIKFIYLPIEFEMSDDNDIVRGQNSDVQIDTDMNLRELVHELGIDYQTLTGSVEFRCECIDNLFAIHGINKL